MGKKRQAMNWVGILHRVPEIIGLPLVRNNKGWQGGYYLNGTRHPYRKDKLKVWMWTRNEGTDIIVKEEGGNSMTLQRWLVEYGGALNYKQAYDIMRGNSTPIREFISQFVKESQEGRYVSEEEFAEYCQYDLGRCDLFTWMCRLFGQDRTMEAWAKYDTVANERGDTVFFYRDSEGRITNDKIMRYNFNGKRDKTYISRRFKVADGYTHKAFFGSHLIKEGEPFHCVESEKSALIMSIVEPQKIWVACGGLSQLRDVDSQMWLYPDIDGIERWSAIEGAQIVEWWNGEDVGEHDDIADLVVRKIRNGSIEL